MRWDFNEFYITDDKNSFDRNAICNFLSNESYWAKGQPRETILKSIENSFCFGLFKDSNQIGFARVVSDFCTFAYLCDLYILDEYRSKGIGTFFMNCVLGHPQVKEVKWLLKTKYSQSLYRRLGFSEITEPGWMKKER